RRPKLLKVEIREQLLDDLKSGMDKAIAAEKYLISIQTITTLLRTEVGLHHLWSAARKERERHAARQKWQAATGEAGMLGTKVIRSIVPAAYAWLYRNDRVWLQAHLPEREKQAVNHASVSWDQRDSDLAQLVERAGLVLRSRNGGKRLHLWELSQHVPDLRAKLSALHRLPLTKRAIQLALAMPSTSYFQEQELF
ncbi:MAG TPA: TnsD family Tn7-like transposition protein, partial [Burkholderiaceae bacterium]|nr:TnsD family Tn7-like transposition protein [Burkholderiaceae bacterium]